MFARTVTFGYAFTGLVILWTLACLPSHAQRGWIALYDTESVISGNVGVTTSSDGSVYVSGPSGGRLLTVKYSAEGRRVWTASHEGATENTVLNRCAVTSDGVVVVTTVGPAGSPDVLIAKYAMDNGVERWFSIFSTDTQTESNRDLPHDMDIDNGGNVYVVGSWEKENQERTYGFVIKIRGSDGSRVGEDLEWEADLRGLAVDNGANVYVVGSSFSYPQWGLVIAKYPSGQIHYQSREWVKLLAPPPGYVSCRGEDVQVAPDGTGVYVLGVAEPLSGNNDILVAKYAPDGTLLWSSVYDSGSVDTPGRLCIDVQGNVYVCGVASNPQVPGDTNLVCVKHLSNGQQAWGVQIKHASAKAIATDANGIVYVVGSYSGDHLVAAIDGNSGRILWRQSYDGPPSPMWGSDLATDVTVGTSNVVYVAGIYSISSSQYYDPGPTRFVTMKITPLTVAGRVELDGFEAPTRAWQDVQIRSPDTVANEVGRVIARIGPGIAYHDETGAISCTMPDTGLASYDVSLRAYKEPYNEEDPPCITHWLRRILPEQTVASSGLLNFGQTLQINGDCDGDNEVTTFDFGIIIAAFGSRPGDANWDARADLDGDAYTEEGDVSLFDFGIFSKNFGWIGDDSNWWGGEPCNY